MTIKVFLRYDAESMSFYNKTLVKGLITFFVFLLLVGISVSEPVTVVGVLGVVLFVYALIGIRTICLKKRYDEFRKRGIKCQGKIVEKVVRKGRYDYDSRARSTFVHLTVAYEHPYTGEAVLFETDSVNGCPYTYLSSLDVTVYVLPDGRAWATDFKRVKKLKDAVKYQPGFVENVRRV